MTPSVEAVALRALAYRELGKGCSTGPREEFDDLIEDFETGHEGISLLTMIASEAFGESDWRIVRQFERPKTLRTLPDLLKYLSGFDFLRAEALLHAWPEDAPEPPTPGTLDGLDRWQEVEQAMDRFRDLGITTLREDVDLVARRSYMSATGTTLSDYLDSHERED